MVITEPLAETGPPPAQSRPLIKLYHLLRLALTAKTVKTAMYDVYCMIGDEAQRIVANQGYPLPPSVDASKWRKLGSTAKVANDIKNAVSTNGFYHYKSFVAFEEREILGTMPKL